MKKVVLFIVNDLNIGGIETYLLRFLKDSGKHFTPVVLCKSGKGGQLEEEYMKLGVRIVRLKIPYFPLLSLVKLYRLLKFYKINSVCDFNGDFSGIHLLVSKQAGVKNRICFYRGSTYRFKKSFFRKIYTKIINYLVFMNSTKILSNSYEALHSFHSKRLTKSTKFRVIRNGVRLSDYTSLSMSKLSIVRDSLNIPKGSFIIGHVGRYDSSKNHESIFKTANKICGKYPNVYFILCGLNVAEGLKDFRFESLDIRKRVVSLGVRTDIPNLLQIMDAFYFPSITEGQPNALIEAMVNGLPFVASNINPIKECVPESYHKFLIDPYDIDSSVRFLSSFIKINSRDKFIKLQNFAKLNYDAQDKFKDFFKEL
jgi:glycosyltransferase involved in cell wall biosynthesis